MVLRILWNVSAGLVQRALSSNKNGASGLAVKHPAVWRARPGFLDCDVNLHLNNASYLFNMELARWHYTAVTGILTQAVKNRRVFLVGSQAIRYRHAIPPFRPYEIRTRIVFADDAWVYFLHQFQCPTTGKLYAEGLARVTVRERGRKVSAAAMIAEVDDGAHEVPAAMPDVVRAFLSWDDASRESMERAADEAAAAVVAATPKPKRSLLAELTRSWNLPV